MMGRPIDPDEQDDEDWVGLADGGEDDILSITPPKGSRSGGLSALKGPQAPGSMPNIDPEGIDMLATTLRDMSARKKYNEALTAMMGRKPQTGRLNIPLLQFAAQMMRPTKSGSFGEALSGAVPAGIQSFQQEREFETGRQDMKDSMSLKMLEGAADDERATEMKLFQAMLAKHNKAPQEIRTKDGVFLRYSDGRTERMGDLPDSQASSTVNTAQGVFRIDPDGKETRIGDLPPGLAQPTAMYESTDAKFSATRDNEYYDKIIAAGSSARAQNRAIDVLDAALEKAPVDGAGAPFINNVLSWGSTFGIDPEALGLGEGAAPGEVVRGFTARLVLDKTGGSLGVGISNADRDFLEYQMPRFGNTDGANKVMSKLMKRLNDREVEVLKFADKYKKEHDGKVSGMREAIDAEFGDRSIFDTDGKGTFTKEYMQGLMAEPGQPTIGDGMREVERMRMIKGAQAEKDFRTNIISADERDRRLKKLGY